VQPSFARSRDVVLVLRLGLGKEILVRVSRVWKMEHLDLDSVSRVKGIGLVSASRVWENEISRSRRGLESWKKTWNVSASPRWYHRRNNRRDRGRLVPTICWPSFSKSKKFHNK